MAHKSDLIATDIEAYLQSQQEKLLLRFITCGSVDDGKSTLIGRLLYESKMIFEDQLQALAAESKKAGTQSDKIDFALLVDGLASEREQGITIDVAYRFFSTEKRKFIVADTPGHEQYTRNMATGASTASLAIVLVDARHGLLTQTQRHSFIVSKLGIKNIILAVNKMDLVEYSQQVFAEIEISYRQFAKELGGLDNIVAIPLSALEGDNVTEISENLDWYNGPSLMSYLESVEVDNSSQSQPFRMPVQWVNRPHLDFRGFAGQVASGVIRKGDKIKVLPSAKESSIERIVFGENDLDQAVAGQSVTVTLADEIDISRGDVICEAGRPPEAASQFEVTLLWMDEDDMLPGRLYYLKCGAQTVQATITKPKYKIDVNTLAHEATNNLTLNEIGVCNISLDRNLAFDPYEDNREMGSFILIDRMSNATVGLGMFHFALRRSSNIHWQSLEVDREARSAIKGQKPCVLWFTGLSGSGKSTIANLVEKKLVASGHHSILLDGDNVRHGLNRDLGFTDTDRVENIRRIAEVSKLMTEAGLIVLVSFISPFKSERQMARDLFEDGEFLEVFVDTPLEVAEERDVKGLYAKARAGNLKNFTGIDSPYEAPQVPEIHISTVSVEPDQAAQLIFEELEARQFLVC